MYRLEYLGTAGWWTGHAGMEIKDIRAYVKKVNANSHHWPMRAIDLDTGEIIGDATPCSVCDEPHTGLDGSCLL